MELVETTAMIEPYQSNFIDHSLESKKLNNFVYAGAGWKAVYYINDVYYVEDIVAYAFIESGQFHELIPLTFLDLHLPRKLQDFVLKEGYIGVINPDNELVVNEDNIGEQEIDLNNIKQALTKNRYKLD
ncbi:hypothetical protein [Cyanothece sp. BG0011]|uniref:hypothetical protein n=1 Tax=Cyanothece sp. BG0011 TaxID=2082950 RepID=UPI0018E595C5|nr:hypothetical protein [Cyanothece sp. BG0011]